MVFEHYDILSHRSQGKLAIFLTHYHQMRLALTDQLCIMLVLIVCTVHEKNQYVNWKHSHQYPKHRLEMYEQ